MFSKSGAYRLFAVKLYTTGARFISITKTVLDKKLDVDDKVMGKAGPLRLLTQMVSNRCREVPKFSIENLINIAIPSKSRVLHKVAMKSNVRSQESNISKPTKSSIDERPKTMSKRGAASCRKGSLLAKSAQLRKRNAAFAAHVLARAALKPKPDGWLYLTSQEKVSSNTRTVRFPVLEEESRTTFIKMNKSKTPEQALPKATTSTAQHLPRTNATQKVFKRAPVPYYHQKKHVRKSVGFKTEEKDLKNNKITSQSNAENISKPTTKRIPRPATPIMAVPQNLTLMTILQNEMSPSQSIAHNPNTKAPPLSDKNSTNIISIESVAANQSALNVSKFDKRKPFLKKEVTKATVPVGRMRNLVNIFENADVDDKPALKESKSSHENGKVMSSVRKFVEQFRPKPKRAKSQASLKGNNQEPKSIELPAAISELQKREPLQGAVSDFCRAAKTFHNSKLRKYY